MPHHVAKRCPVLNSSSRSLKRSQGAEGFLLAHHLVEHTPGSAWANSGKQLKGAKTGHSVAQVLRPTQNGHHVLDVSGFEKLQASELHERDISAGELDLQSGTVAGCTEKHRLGFQANARFAVLEHLPDDVVGLTDVVADAHEHRPFR